MLYLFAPRFIGVSVVVLFPEMIARWNGRYLPSSVLRIGGLSSIPMGNFVPEILFLQNVRNHRCASLTQAVQIPHLFTESCNIQTLASLA